MLNRRTLIQVSLAAGLVAGLAGFATVANLVRDWQREHTGWHQIAWPFPRDAWPAGRAWRGEGGIEVYVRPKLGFCGNCETGVVADEEVDGVTDLDLLDEHFAPVQAGSRIRITDLFGRPRAYRLKAKDGPPRPAQGVPVASKVHPLVAA